MRISIGINWQGGLDMDSVVEQAKVADDSGVDAIFVAEAWGRDAFTTLAVLARETHNVKLGTSIVNIFSRTPAALAQHFATLDELSGGRMIIGLGASGPQVIEDFHGIEFRRPLTRMREYVDIINTLNRGERLNYDGHFFQLGRGFTLRDVNLLRDHIPIYIASLTPRSVQQTAAIADGWFPIYVPRHRWQDQVGGFQEYVRAAGRDPEEVTIRSANTVSVTDDPERTYRGIASTTAFYIARMGDFYYDHLLRPFRAHRLRRRGQRGAGRMARRRLRRGRRGDPRRLAPRPRRRRVRGGVRAVARCGGGGRLPPPRGQRAGA